MKIYLVKLNYEYGQGSIIGAYTNEDRANAVANQTYEGDWVSVDELELDEKILSLPLDKPL